MWRFSGYSLDFFEIFLIIIYIILSDYLIIVAPSQPYNPNSDVEPYNPIPVPQEQNYVDDCKGLDLASIKCATNPQLSSNYNNVNSIAQNSHSYDSIDGSISQHHSFHASDPKGLVIDVRQDPSTVSSHNNIINSFPQTDSHHVAHIDPSINSYTHVTSHGIGSVNTIDSSNEGIGRLIPKFDAYYTNYGLVIDVRDIENGNSVHSFTQSVSKYEKTVDSFSIDNRIDISSDVDSPISLPLINFNAKSTYSYTKNEGIVTSAN